MRAFVPLLALLLVLPAATAALSSPLAPAGIAAVPDTAPEVPTPIAPLAANPAFGTPVTMPGGGRGEPGLKVDRIHNDIWVHSFESSWSSLNGGPFQVDGPLVPLSGDGEIALGYPGGEFPHRVYKMDLTVACESLAWKDLDFPVDTDPTGLGTWLRDDAACGIPVQDRQWLATGPNVLPDGSLQDPILPGTTHPEALYLAVNQIPLGLQVAKAVPILTGGVPHFTQIVTVPGGCFRGNIAVDQNDGTVYVADCDGNAGATQRAFVSTDGGLTWSARPIPGSGPSILFPAIDVDDAGNIYMTWTDANTHDVMFASSTNKGITWSTKVVNEVPQGTVFPWIVAGSDGKVDIVYLGTQRDIAPGSACPNVAGGSCDNNPPGVVDLWYVYMAQSLNAHDANPTFTEVQAVVDPANRGNICTSGTGCPGGITGGAPRHLADFIQVDYDANGNAVIAFADGCPGTCASTGPISTSAVTTVVRQTSGTVIVGGIPPPPPAVHITVPSDGATVEPAVLTVNGTVDRDDASTTPDLTAEAGGPYSGGEGTAIPIVGGATGGDAPYSCSWSGSGATFASATSCSTTVTFATAGSYTITLTVTDAASETDTDTASVTALSPSTDRVLWLVGDGSANVGPASFPVGVAKKNFAMSPANNGNRLTTFTSLGPSDMDDPANPFGPTFVYGGDVTLRGSPVTLKTHVAYRNPLNAAGEICPLGAQLFTEDGAILGPAGGVQAFVPFSTAPLPVSFEFVPDLSAVGGSYTGGLIVQVGTIGIDCGDFAATWSWGSANENGRLVLGVFDSGGGAGPTASLPAVTLPTAGPSGMAMFRGTPLAAGGPLFDPLAAEPSDDGPLLGVWGEVGDVSMSNDADALTVRLNLPGLLDGFVPTEFGSPFTYQVSFRTTHNFADAAGVGLEYRATYTYDILSLETGVLLADTFDLLVTTAENAGGLASLCPVTTDLSQSFFDTTTFDVVWVIPLSAFTHDNQAAQGNCPGFTTGGDALASGDTLTDIVGEAAVKLVIVTIGGLGDTTDPGTYTLTGGSFPVAEAGGPYFGANGAAIAIAGTATGGTAPYSCSWSGTGATFADASDCTTTVTYSSSGAHGITLTVTDAASETDTDTATVTTADPERVEVQLADRSATASVDTSVSETDTWSVELNLTGLADGTYNLTATWKESNGDVIDVDVIQVVVDGNDPPFITVPGPQSVDEGQTLGFLVSATDPDGDDVTLSASGLPPGAVFFAQSGFFNWTPDFTQAGSYVVNFTADDGNGGTDSGSVSITVNDVDRAPVLEDVPDRSVVRRTLLQFTIVASDPDGDLVNYSADSLPTGATLNAVTGEFNWIPTNQQVGTHTIVFRANSGALSDSDAATITVTRN